MEKYKKFIQKYPFMKKDIDIEITTNPSCVIGTRIHVRHHMRDILKMTTLVVVTSDTKEVTELDSPVSSDTTPELPMSLRSTQSRLRGHHCHHPDRKDRNPGTCRICLLSQSPRSTRLRTRKCTEQVHSRHRCHPILQTT